MMMETSHGPSMNGSGVRKLASPRLKARPVATVLSPRSSLPQHRRIQCIGHYDLDKTIGQGQFGKVKLATHVLTGERVPQPPTCLCLATKPLNLTYPLPSFHLFRWL